MSSSYERYKEIRDIKNNIDEIEKRIRDRQKNDEEISKWIRGEGEKEDMKRGKTKAWCVKGPDGKLYPFTCNRDEGLSADSAEKCSELQKFTKSNLNGIFYWCDLASAGFKVVRVKIKEIEKE